MFENLSERLSGVFDRLTKQGALSDEDVKTALREVRVALLEADVSLPVARDFVKAVQDKATGQSVTKSITPGQQVVKIVHDELVHVLAGEGEPGALKIDNPPTPILMVGLQGSGKTTTIGKLASQFRAAGKSVIIAAGDTFRAAAVEQLEIWGERAGVPVLKAAEGSDPAALAFDALQRAEAEGVDLLMIDTAGRLQNRQDLMEELAKIIRVLRKKDPSAPHNTLLVLDATTGQNALSQVETFQKMADVSGLVMTCLLYTSPSPRDRG